MPIDRTEEIEVLTKQLRGVSCRLEELAPLLNTNDSLFEDMFIDELMYAQKLIIALTKDSVGDDGEEQPEENEDSAFMPGELDDVISEKEPVEAE